LWNRPRRVARSTLAPESRRHARVGRCVGERGRSVENAGQLGAGVERAGQAPPLCRGLSTGPAIEFTPSARKEPMVRDVLNGHTAGPSGINISTAPTTTAVLVSMRSRTAVVVNIDTRHNGRRRGATQRHGNTASEGSSRGLLPCRSHARDPIMTPEGEAPSSVAKCVPIPRSYVQCAPPGGSS